jgi:hypothetical protein
VAGWPAFGLSLGVAGVATPALIKALRRRDLRLANFRGARVPLPTGVVIPVAGAVSLGALAVLDRTAGVAGVGVEWARPALYVAGITALGAVDDAAKLRAGTGAVGPRGLRAHARAVRSGRPTTGLLKALGALVLAPVVLSDPVAGGRGEVVELLPGVGVLVLAPHVFNLLDLRPGRSIKAFLALGLVLTGLAGSGEALPLLSAFLAPILVLLFVDLAERGMLGDAGAGAVGAVAGLWLVLALPPAGEGLALGALVLATLYGELRSISALVDRTRVLRRIDELGRLGESRGVPLPR